MQKSKHHKALYAIFYQLATHGQVSKTNSLKNSPCWEHNKQDYKQVDCRQFDQYFDSNVTLLHRLMYAVFYDQALTPKDIIMHKCHNRRCFNPLHLELGDTLKNNRATIKRSKKSKKA